MEINPRHNPAADENRTNWPMRRAETELGYTKFNLKKQETAREAFIFWMDVCGNIWYLPMKIQVPEGENNTGKHEICISESSISKRQWKHATTSLRYCHRVMK